VYRCIAQSCDPSICDIHQHFFNYKQVASGITYDGQNPFVHWLDKKIAFKFWKQVGYYVIAHNQGGPSGPSETAIEKACY
jgi:hypothetical protein